MAATIGVMVQGSISVLQVEEIKDWYLSLQSRFELGQEPGELLAQAALDCGIHNRSFLQEIFQYIEPTTPNSDMSSFTGAFRPPVPPKSPPSRPSPQGQSVPTNYALDERRAMEATTLISSRLRRLPFLMLVLPGRDTLQIILRYRTRDS